MSRKSSTTVAVSAANNQIAAPVVDLEALKLQCELKAKEVQESNPERKFLNECIAKMGPVATSSKTGEDLEFNDVFFVIRMCENLRPLIIKYLPYPTHKDKDGKVFYGRQAKPELLPVVKTILDAYGIVYSEEILQKELERINKVALQ